MAISPVLKTKPLDARKFALMALAHIEKRAERIRHRREDELRLTQEQVAERMQDIHRERSPEAPPDRTRGQMVSDWERAVNEPSAPKLELLAAALDWTVADLNADQPDKTETPDPMAQLNGDAAAAIQRKLDEVLDQQAELLSEISQVRAEQERLRRHQEPGEHGEEETGG